MTGRKARALHTLAVALRRSCVASMSWERAATAAANVMCARSIRRPRRRALLLPHTKGGVEAGAMRRPEGVVYMHCPGLPRLRAASGSKGQNHRAAEGRSFRARGCDQNVAVLLLHHER